MLSRLVTIVLSRSKRLLMSWLQSPSAVIWEPRKIKSATVSPSIGHEVMRLDAMILVFWMLSFKPTFSLSSFTFIKKIFSSSSLSAIRVVSSANLRLLVFLPAILIPTCASSSPAFLIIYSAHKLNNQGDNIQPWHTPFPIWKQSVVTCSVLTVASWPAYRFLKRQVRWSGIPISWRISQFLVIYTVKGFGIVNKAERDVILELSCFLNDPSNVGNLISGSFARNQLEHLEVHGSHIAKAWLGEFLALCYSRVRWVQLCSSLSILWHCLSLGLEWKLTFSSPMTTAEFSKFAGILSSALSQHHLQEFEIAQLECHHPHWLCS